jgi:leader peptidase (prepilin peptidase) / N-methyltransferase
MTALVVVVAVVLGLVVGLAVDRAAARYPWPPQKRSWSSRADTPVGSGVSPPELHDRGTRRWVVAVGTALLFALAALRFGASWALPAYLFLAGAGMCLAVIDLQHSKLPNRVVVPSIGIGAALLVLAAAGEHAWPALLRAGIAGVILFAVFLVLALISPRSLGMGDVKLAALLGLYLGWLGWGAVLLGAAAGFVVQALVALVLLATRRITLRGELPFGPAMLLGAALVIGWSGALLP